MQNWKNGLFSAAAGAGGGGSLEPLTFRDSDTDTSDTSHYTFSNMALGDAYTGRYLVLAFGYIDLSRTLTTTVQVGGVSATQMAFHERDNGSAEIFSYIYTVPYPTGTTADVDIFTQGTVGGIAIGLWSVGGQPATSGSAVKLSGDINYNNTSLTVPSGGFGIFVSMVQNGDDAVITGDATKRFGLDSNSNEWVSGSDITDEGSSSSNFDLGDTDSVLLGQAFSVS